jgi:hypothetical protein
MMNANIRIERAALESEAALRLIAALNAELEQRYPEDGANFFSLDPSEIEPGSGAFLLAFLTE